MKSHAFTVRDAKARFSALLDRVATGEEIIVTSHGKPKAKIVPFEPATVLDIDLRWLKAMPVGNRRTSSDALIRAERDERD